MCRKSPPDLLEKNFTDGGNYIQKYGKAFNTIRNSMGIPIIEEDWIAHENGPDYVFWMNPKRIVTATEPMHFHKTSEFIDGELFYEKDAFHYETKGDTAYRLLAIAYLDNNFCIDSLVFDFITYYKGRYPPSEDKYIDLHQADSVLNQWGFLNLYQP